MEGQLSFFEEGLDMNSQIVSPHSDKTDHRTPLERKIDDSKDILRLAAEMSELYYQKPLAITYSGGKDSDVLLYLALECLKPSQFEVVNSHTTVDAPDTVYHIRETFKNLNEQGVKTSIQYPRDKDGNFESMWSLIVKNGIPPTRLARYCCRVLKETSLPNRFIAVGVRESESSGRKGKDSFTTREKTKADAKFYNYEHTREVFETAKQKMVENNESPNDHNVWDCNLITKAKDNIDLICYPIYKWLDSEIWMFIHDRGIKYNPLYDEGFQRVGCVGCPFAGNQRQVLERFPKYKQNYILAFDKMIRTSKKKKHNWETGEDVYKWWIQDETIEGQMNIFDFIEKEGQ